MWCDLGGGGVLGGLIVWFDFVFGRVWDMSWGLGVRGFGVGGDFSGCRCFGCCCCVLG